MKTELLAHSAKQGIPAQTYEKHVCNVIALARENAQEAVGYYTGDRDSLISSIQLAAEFHDLGKVDQLNQATLADDSRRNKLPRNHVDAGVAHVLRSNNLLAALLIYSHHVGLPDLAEESTRGINALRDFDLKGITDDVLEVYLQCHSNALGRSVDCNNNPDITSLLVRIAISCLVDADHFDTAIHYGGFVPKQNLLLPEERLSLLDDYIKELGKPNYSSPRNALRGAIYRACRKLDPQATMYACDSPVGTGKTTAVMAHMLRVAERRGLRRVFVVLPFTNIIDQSVDVYRKALVRAGEHSEDVVAAHHHKAEFEDHASRQFAFLWNPPVVVITAVQFFETLAGSRTGALRKLHQLPGSAVFIDEAHAALPAHLWPQAWRWLRELERSWGCHFVLGSGSLNRFWELEDFSDEGVQLPELVSTQVRVQGVGIEQHRITYQ
ncbi:MAG: DEAD/DEAH box helicase family protein, partial [Eubacteriales bacterium]|nr:DEAD/DEAH box helicase family protein [Eubacteriales bacterium]